ncbi:MAG: FtsX-like permease family protein [Xanthomonadaceae bacterium]|jgi:putative ABC transport system permease protein|nr:FtsX-like permease family protein [Xanthomonadaceae bacterium]
MRIFRYALRAIRREFLAGDLLTVFVALMLGVAVITAVGTLANRVTLALGSSAADIIGGDLGLSSRQEIPDRFVVEAQRRGLRSTRIASFPSVLFNGDANQMASIKAVDEHYPLRGELLVAKDANGLGSAVAGAPAPGEAYLDPRLLDALGLRVGDDIEFGAGYLRIARVLKSEPDASGELIQMAPPMLANRADVDAAGLLGPGSRASYRLMFAGASAEIARFREWLQPRRDGLRLVGIKDSQRGLRDAFDRAGQFLAMAALLAVLLAGVATALAANRFAVRRIDTVVILRCLGARQRDILNALLLQLVFLAIPACLFGLGLGLATQAGLVALLGELVPDRLPLPQAAPALSGGGIGLLLLLGFGLPPLLRLRGIPPSRVFNRSFNAVPPVSALIYLLALAATVALAVLAVGDLELAGWILGGLALLALAATVAGALLLWMVRALQGRMHGAWRLGLAALTQRRLLSIAQLVSLSLSLCALLLLAVIGPSLLQQWRMRLPADTPNYFLLNIQVDQREAIAAALHDFGIVAPELEPFGTGRLMAINDAPPQRRRDADETNDDDADRPVNFSWQRTLPPANDIVAGRFWNGDSRAFEASLAETWAQRYGIAPGDRLTLLIGDQQLDFTVTSLRKVEWDSFRVNFFLLLNAGAIAEDAPHNLISSFYLPRDQSGRLGALVRQFPNISVIDIDAILQQVREIIERVAQAAQWVMGFSLAAGTLVLLAALQATAGERRYDSAVLRTLGARRAQLRTAVLVEFGALGFLAAVLAVLATAAIGAVVSRQIFDLALSPPWLPLMLGGGIGTVLSIIAGWWGTRRILRTPPALALRGD